MHENFNKSREIQKFDLAISRDLSNRSYGGGGGGVFLIAKVLVNKRGFILPKEAPPSPILETFMSVIPRER